MRTLLIYHAGSVIDEEVLKPWLSSFSTLAGMIALHETPGQRWARIRRELKRVGWLRFLDVIAFRIYYQLMLAPEDRRRQEVTVRQLRDELPPVPDEIPVLHTHSANSEEARHFIEERTPDLMIARCKQLLKAEVFTIPSHGTWVMHPGICPEYRNAHGCFWALAEDEPDKVGLTLLRIDEGVDTGPVYGYYSYDFDEVHESHQVIQRRVLLDNLDELETRLTQIFRDEAEPLDTRGRSSATWGQPWLSRHLRWKWRARQRHNQ